MSKEKIWGPIIYEGTAGDEKADEIQRLIDQQIKLKNSPVKFKEGETINEVKARRQKKIQELEKKIWDLIYKKRAKTEKKKQ